LQLDEVRRLAPLVKKRDLPEGSQFLRLSVPLVSHEEGKWAVVEDSSEEFTPLAQMSVTLLETDEVVSYYEDTSTYDCEEIARLTVEQMVDKASVESALSYPQGDPRFMEYQIHCEPVKGPLADVAGLFVEYQHMGSTHFYYEQAFECLRSYMRESIGVLFVLGAVGFKDCLVDESDRATRVVYIGEDTSKCDPLCINTLMSGFPIPLTHVALGGWLDRLPILGVGRIGCGVPYATILGPGLTSAREVKKGYGSGKWESVCPLMSLYEYEILMANPALFDDDVCGRSESNYRKRKKRRVRGARKKKGLVEGNFVLLDIVTDVGIFISNVFVARFIDEEYHENGRLLTPFEGFLSTGDVPLRDKNFQRVKAQYVRWRLEALVLGFDLYEGWLSPKGWGGKLWKWHQYIELLRRGYDEIVPEWKVQVYLSGSVT